MSDADTGDAAAALREGPDFGFGADPENPGWKVRPASTRGAFLDVFGTIRVKVEAGDRARVRIQPGRQHRNYVGSVHGGFLLAVVDQVLFVAPSALGIQDAIGGVTVDCSSHFLAPAGCDEPLDAVVEVLRETGRMVFMRGLIVQGDTTVLSFSGVIRKASRR